MNVAVEKHHTERAAHPLLERLIRTSGEFPLTITAFTTIVEFANAPACHALGDTIHDLMGGSDNPALNERGMRTCILDLMIRRMENCVVKHVNAHADLTSQSLIDGMEGARGELEREPLFRSYGVMLARYAALLKQGLANPTARDDLNHLDIEALQTLCDADYKLLIGGPEETPRQIPPSHLEAEAPIGEMLRPFYTDGECEKFSEDFRSALDIESGFRAAGTPDHGSAVCRLVDYHVFSDFIRNGTIEITSDSIPAFGAMLAGATDPGSISRILANDCLMLINELHGGRVEIGQQRAVRDIDALARLTAQDVGFLEATCGRDPQARSKLDEIVPALAYGGVGSFDLVLQISKSAPSLGQVARDLTISGVKAQRLEFLTGIELSAADSELVTSAYRKAKDHGLHAYELLDTLRRHLKLIDAKSVDIWAKKEIFEPSLG